MQPQLPIELVQRILDFVVSDEGFMLGRYDIEECALVCRAWAPICQAMLHDTVLFIDSSLGGLRQVFIRLNNRPERLPSIKQARIFVKRYPYRPIVELFAFMLAPLLPSLRKLIINSHRVPLYYHRFYSFSRFPITTVTSLQLEDFAVRDLADLHGILALCPSLRTLEMYSVVWMSPNPRRKKPSPVQLCRSTPAVARLSLANETVNGLFEKPEIAERNSRNLRLLLSDLENSLAELEINIRVYEYLTSPLFGPIIPHFNMSNLQILDIHLRGPCLRVHTPQEPYATHMSRLPKFIHALNALNLRILSFYFCQFEIEKSEEDFLGYLRELSQGLSDMVLSSRLPLLEKVRFDVAARVAAHSYWSLRLAECFPLLLDLGVLETIIYIPPWALGPFTDPGCLI
ncbi:hypothetical protein OH77DRAFT_283614 [Trametes cingulata]|nr:hypothetical protein OH77DRAFT_283614 [Trametes cingulata]